MSAPRRTVRNSALSFQKAPKLFFHEVLGVEHLEDYQDMVIETVAREDRVAVAACHDVGKSFLMARIAMWFLNTRPNSKVITTAPTFNQVERILWSEIRAAHARAKFPLGGKLNMTDWTFNPEWFALGFSPRNESNGGEGQGTQSSFQGFHAPGGIMVIFDEATGIPHNIWTMAEGLLTQAKVKFVAIGNPTSSGSAFYSCFKDPAWAKIYLSCFDSPNLKANNINNIADLEREIQKVKALNDDEARKYLDSYKAPVPYLLTTKWVVASAKKWGIEHPLTVSKILGKFPQAGDNTLLPLGYVEEAQRRVVWPEVTDRKIIGIDVARYGTDSTELTALHGKKQLGRKALFKNDNVEVAGEAIAWARELWPNEDIDVFVVDGTGTGSGVVDVLKREVSDNTEVREVQFGAGVECDGPESCEHKDCEKAKYETLKARMFGLLQADLKDEEGLSLIDDAVYLDELPTIRYSFDKKGRMVIESKDAYKKRTRRGSPDRADSLALANFGRYDELKAGSFTKVTKQKARRPHASGLRSSDKKW